MFRSINGPVKSIDMVLLMMNPNITEEEIREYCLFGFILGEE